jgi:hypothetical protein
MKNVIPSDMREKALRRLNLEIMRVGITPYQIQEWHRTTAFPTLRWESEFMDIRNHIESYVFKREDEMWAETQIIMRFPDEEGVEGWSEFHVDEPPPWARGRQYRTIVGVPLSRCHDIDGAPATRSGDGKTLRIMHMDAGDLLIMEPDTLHASGLNVGGQIRYMLYFRLLGAG